MKILITLSQDCYKIEWLRNRVIANIQHQVENVDLQLVEKYGIVAADIKSGDNETADRIKRIRGVEDVEIQQEKSIYRESI